MRTIIFLIVSSYIFYSRILGEETSSEKKIICYFNSIAKYRQNNTSFTIDNVPEFCTHVVFSFTEYNQTKGLNPLEKDGDVIAFEGFPSLLKLSYPKTKIIFSIPNLDINSWKVQEDQSLWINNIIEILRKYKYDGIEIGVQNYEFETTDQDFNGEEFNELMKIIRKELEDDGKNSGKPRLLFSVLLPAKYYSQIKADPKVDIFDWMGIAEHIQEPRKNPILTHISPLYTSNSPNINTTVSRFIERGLSSNKLALALPFFGKTYQLTSPDKFQLGVEAKGHGNAGPFTLQNGFMAYFEICIRIKDENWEVVEESIDHGPFAHKGDQWVSYDNTEMVKKKAKFAAENKLGGIILLALDFDDFMGYCGEGNFPLSRAAVNMFLKS